MIHFFKQHLHTFINSESKAINSSQQNSRMVSAIQKVKEESLLRGWSKACIKGDVSSTFELTLV
jgi:hypothetical protein